jgi:hypothetical protein
VEIDGAGVEDNDLGGTSDQEDDDELVTHTLPFKCIGAARERHRQEELERAYHILHIQNRDVQVKLRPEPNNERDSKAIGIDMDYGSGWIHVGYIASELTMYIHPLLLTGDIVNMSVEHIRFQVYFLKIGFYPKILITRNGAWDPFVIHSSRSVR